MKPEVVETKPEETKPSKPKPAEKPKLRKLTDLVIQRYEEEVSMGIYDGPHKISLLSTIKTTINRQGFNPEDIRPFVEKFINKEGNAFNDLIIYRGISEDYAALLSYIDLTAGGTEAAVPKGINAFNIERLKEL